MAGGTFYIGAKGALILKRKDGSLAKTGLRFRDNRLFFYDNRSGEWIQLPEEIRYRSGGVVRLYADILRSQRTDSG